MARPPRAGDVPLIVRNDFDEAEFGIVGTFRDDTRPHVTRDVVEVAQVALRLVERT